jgi:hypothetical protein
MHPVRVRSPQVRFRRTELSISTERSRAFSFGSNRTMSIGVTTRVARNPEHHRRATAGTGLASQRISDRSQSTPPDGTGSGSD